MAENVENTGANEVSETSEAKFPLNVPSVKEGDSEVEVTTKRSLLRLNMDKAYERMAFAVHSRDNFKNSMVWFTRLLESLHESEETLQPIYQKMKSLYQEVNEVTTGTIEHVRQIEIFAEKERSTVRKIRMAPKNSEAEPVTTTKVTPVDPLSLIKQVTKNLNTKPELKSE